MYIYIYIHIYIYIYIYVNTCFYILKVLDVWLISCTIYGYVYIGYDGGGGGDQGAYFIHVERRLQEAVDMVMRYIYIYIYIYVYV
jgi:hypothetical protein